CCSRLLFTLLFYTVRTYLYSFPTRRSSDLRHLHWKGNVTYARATDDQDANLPFIRPLSYQTSLHWMHRQFSVMASIKGDLTQEEDRKSTRLNSSHVKISYAVFCLKKKK